MENTYIYSYEWDDLNNSVKIFKFKVKYIFDKSITYLDNRYGSECEMNFNKVRLNRFVCGQMLSFSNDEKTLKKFKNQLIRKSKDKIRRAEKRLNNLDKKYDENYNSLIKIIDSSTAEIENITKA